MAGRMSAPLVCPFCGCDSANLRQVGEDWSCIGCSAELAMIMTDNGPEVDVLREPPPEEADQ